MRRPGPIGVWLLAAALMCLTVVAVQRARAETPADRADRLYRERDAQGALAAYQAIVAGDPLDVVAWLRIGHLHRRAGRDEAALAAYRQATLGTADDAGSRDVRARALLNVALVHVALASRAIDEVDALRVGSLRGERNDVARQVGAQRHRTERSATPAPRLDAEAPAAEPYTVDRWVGTLRRQAAAPARGRASLADPLTETPLPPPPAVDVLSGGGGSGRTEPPDAGRAR